MTTLSANTEKVNLMTEIIVVVIAIFSLFGNYKQHEVIKEQEVKIAQLSENLDDSIRICNENTIVTDKISSHLEQCVYDLKESRKVQADFERIVEGVKTDSEKLEADLSRTDWGSTSIPSDIDF